MINRRLFACVFMAVFALCLCACAPSVGELKFEAPKGWTKDRDTARENSVMYSSSSPQGVIALKCKDTAESDLSEDNIAKLREELIEGAKKRGKAVIAEEGKIMAGGQLWLKMSFCYHDFGSPGNKARWSYFMTRHNHKHYTFLMTCREPDYETLKPSLEQVVNSVSFN